MDNVVRRKLWGVRWRESLNRLMECLGGSLLIVGIPALLLVVAEKLLATEVISSFYLLALAGVGLLIALVRWRISRPGWMALAVQLDKRAGLRERMSSILAFKESPDPFARAAVEESLKIISAVRSGEFFPLRVTGKIRYSLLIWAFAVAGWLWLPQGDLLGKKAHREEQARAATQVQVVKKEAQAAVRKVKDLGEKMNQNLLAGLPEDPTKDMALKEPQQARQLALRQIADLQKRVQEVRADPKFNGIEDLQERLRQLRSPEIGPARELSRQLARGQFDKAAAALRDLQRKLMEKDSNLSPEQRAQLAKDLADLAAQLEKLAKQQWQLDNELKKMGLKPELARDLKKLEEALKKLSLDPEQKKKLLATARACQSACKSCRGLSESLSSAAAALGSGKAPDAAEAMAEAGEKLDALEALSQQMELTDASLSDLKDAMEKLGEGECPGCNGEGCSLCRGKGPWKAGHSTRRSMGMGGPGRGEGQVADVKATEFKTEKKRVRGKSQGGPIIADWYIQDREVKGQSVKAFSDVVQNAQQEAAQDIETQHVPKEYQESVKKYFSQLRNTTQAPTTQKGK